MTKEQETQVIKIAKEITGDVSFDYFSEDEYIALYQMSYGFRYGTPLRLALSTGISLGELLTLRWDDFGPNNTLSINKTITSLPMCIDSNSMGNPSCSRLITLPQSVIFDISQLRNAQYTDILKTCSLYDTFQYIVTDNNGCPVTIEAFLREYYGILSAANVRQLPFSAVRNTFVYNSLKAGVDSNIIAQVIGVQSCQSLVIGDAIQQIPQMTNCVIPELNCSKSYPVIVTPDNGDFTLTVVDFGDLSCEKIKDVHQGMDLIVKGLYKKSRQIFMPEPTSPHKISLSPGEYIAVATIKP